MIELFWKESIQQVDGPAFDEQNLKESVSLYYMIVFLALDFYLLANRLGKLEAIAKKQPPEQSVHKDEKIIDKLYDSFDEMGKGCTTLCLYMSKMQVERIKSLVQDGCTNGELHSALQTLHQRIFDELGHSWMFFLAAEKKDYYREPWLTFGQKIAERFPSLTRDIEEAGKCYGTQRNTACVFHLMRIMEFGLRDLAKALDIQSKNPSWDTVLNKIDEELRKRPPEKDPIWLKQERFFAESASHLRSVKIAWRNPVMHVEATYSDEEAKDIYHSVRTFMMHLATNLKKIPEPKEEGK